LDLKEDIHRMQRQITRDGDGLRLMGDDRTLGEHLADTERMLDGVKLAVAHLESLQ
jgi:hypothetical protein